MKQQILTSLYPHNFINYRRVLLWVLLSLAALGAMFLLPSFSSPKLSSSSTTLPFSEPVIFEPTTINFKLNNIVSKGFSIKDASLFKMEQAEDVFAKVLNMSLEDRDGNLIALSLTDLENTKIDTCLTTNLFYGIEHKKSDQNFSNDIGSAIFSNNSSLIYEKNDGTSLISRDGWIKINRCENGRISGGFYFKIEEGNSTELLEGEFVNVLLEIE